LNFFPQYWSLRQRTFDEDCNNDGYATFNPVGLATRQTAPTQCPGPAPEAEHVRTFEPPMQAGDAEPGWPEFEAGLETYQTASIMEYGSVFGLNDQAGLGLYDYAALAYAYGDLVEVFNQPPNKLAILDSYSDGNYTSFGSTFGRSDQLVTTMSDVDDYATRDPATRIVTPDAPIEEDREEYGYAGYRDNGWDYWHYSVIPIMFYDDMQQPTAEDIQALHLSPRVDFNQIGAMWRLYDRSLVPRVQAESDNLVQVPYKYCEDIFAGSQTYDCMRWDTGADNLEILPNIVEPYAAYYPINEIPRDRVG